MWQDIKSSFCYTEIYFPYFSEYFLHINKMKNLNKENGNEMQIRNVALEKPKLKYK